MKAWKCYDPVQAHKLIQTTIWPELKALLIAGHKITLELKQEKRSTEQNRLLWSRLTEVSEQVEWHGQKLTPEDWKHIFSASLKKQTAVPGLDGGFVVLGLSTSKMTVDEMTQLLELIAAFGAERGVIFQDGL